MNIRKQLYIDNRQKSLNFHIFNRLCTSKNSILVCTTLALILSFTPCTQAASWSPTNKREKPSLGDSFSLPSIRPAGTGSSVTYVPNGQVRIPSDPVLEPERPSPPEETPIRPLVYVDTISPNSMTVHWKDQSNVEAGFRLEQRDSRGRWFVVEYFGASFRARESRSYRFSNLLPDTEYCFRVVAYNHLGDSGYDGVATACASTYLEPVTRGCAELEELKLRASAPPAQECPTMPDDGGPIPITGDYTIPKGCDCEGLYFLVTGSDIVFDGNGNTLHYRQRCEEIQVGHSTVRTCEGPKVLPYAITIRNENEDMPTHNIVIRNVNIEGDYESGVRPSNWLHTNKQARLRKAFDPHLHTDVRKRILRDGLDDDLENEYRHNAPHCIHIENVHIYDTANSGLYVEPYVHNVTFDQGSIVSAGKSAIYLDTGTRYNTISNTIITDSNREGIAVDSSAFNLIRNNYFENNHRGWWARTFGANHIRDGGSIFLYKNCWEHAPDKFPRLQHSEGNVIQNNEFMDEFVGVWIGSRQSAHRTGSVFKERVCGDPIMSEEVVRISHGTTKRTYYRDYAEDTIVEDNTFCDVDRGVVVEDDWAIIAGNLFSGDIDVGIEIGSRARNAAREPVTGTDVSDNLFTDSVDTPIKQPHDSTRTRLSNNRRLHEMVWSVDAAHRIWQRVEGQWKNTHGYLKHVSVGSDGEVWGVNRNDQIWRWTGSKWESKHGLLKQISVGSAQHIWGVNKHDQIWRWNGSRWVSVHGLLKHVSVGSDGEVWGVNKHDQIWRWDGSRWHLVPGRLKQISVANAQHIWGVSTTGRVYRWNGGDWDPVSGTLNDVSVGEDGRAWGVHANGSTYRWDGQEWEYVTDNLRQVSYATRSRRVGPSD